ncbi:MAG: T9SS type A sorting domain-containing protein [Bacteroidetes bacterium]|nr:T9SS type A sorting domain-containing protein [Bacteroidota bacterium]MBL6963506.1 T9SS type A sorting domain-containing protein [Bacteroidota bacterium]
MKKIFYILSFLLFLSTVVFSQVFELELYTDTIVKGKPGNEIEIKGELVNHTQSPIGITISRLENNIPANWTSLISTDVCLPHYIDVNNVTIPALSKQEFSFHFVTSADHSDTGNALLEFRNSADAELVLLYRFYCITDSTFVSINKWPANEIKITAYPNPNQGSFNLKYKSNTEEEVKLSIISLTGEEIMTYHLFKVHPPFTLIPISYRGDPGTYLLLISTLKKTSCLPLILIE